jgi:hypothetical protein
VILTASPINVIVAPAGNQIDDVYPYSASQIIISNGILALASVCPCSSCEHISVVSF